jgi:hypothetical protein
MPTMNAPTVAVLLAAAVFLGCDTPITDPSRLPEPAPSLSLGPTLAPTTVPSLTDAPTGSTGTYTGVLVDGQGCLGIRPDADAPWPSPVSNVYELRLPVSYIASRDSDEVKGPDGQVIARIGDHIEIDGTFRRPYGSVCMFGPIIDVAELRRAK